MFTLLSHPLYTTAPAMLQIMIGSPVAFFSTIAPRPVDMPHCNALAAAIPSGTSRRILLESADSPMVYTTDT